MSLRNDGTCHGWVPKSTGPVSPLLPLKCRVVPLTTFNHACMGGGVGGGPPGGQGQFSHRGPGNSPSSRSLLAGGWGKWKRPKWERPIGPVAWGRGSGVGGDWGPQGSQEETGDPSPLTVTILHHLPFSLFMICSDLVGSSLPTAIISFGMNWSESRTSLGRKSDCASSHTCGFLLLRPNTGLPCFRGFQYDPFSFSGVGIPSPHLPHCPRSHSRGSGFFLNCGT